MKDLKHTKGEWIFDKINGTIVLDAERRIDVDLWPHQYAYKYEFEANAKLIASAPELLEALIHANTLLKTASEVLPSLSERVKKNNELIKKATS